MRLYRNVGILVAVLVILAGVTTWLVLTSGSDSDGDEERIQLVKLDREKLTELTVENSDGKFVFKKNGTEWELVSGGKFGLDTNKLDSIASNATDLSADKLIEENSSSLEQYGLASPVRVTVKTSDDVEEIVEIGNPTPTAQGYYVKKAGSNTVYTISAIAGDIMKASKKDLRDKYILSVYSGSVTMFGLERDGQKVFKAEKSEEKGWVMLEPIGGSVNMIRLNTALEAFIRTYINDFVEENPQDLSKYGLDNPTYVVEAATANERMKIFIGNEERKDYTFYAMVDGSNEVIIIDASTLSFLDINAVEVYETLVYAPMIYDVSEVIVNMDGKTVTSKIESDSAKPGEDKFTIDGINVTEKGKEAEQAYRNFYRSLIGVIFDEIELLDHEPTGSPEITLTYNLEIAPGQVKIEFIPRDDSTYYVLKNGEYTGAVVKKRVFDEADGIRKNYQKLMEAVK